MALIGEIRLAAFGTVPPGWISCNGQLLNIDDFLALFNLIGTTYGGDGSKTFALPDLRGRVPIHPESPSALGIPGGEETHVLTVAETPVHTHSLMMKPVPATSSTPKDCMLATSPATLGDVYGSTGQAKTMSEFAIHNLAGSTTAPHSNMQPYMALMFIIAFNGIFPTK